MQDFGTKANDTAGPSGQLSADEFNNLATELENAVTRAGLGLTGASVTQMAQSLFLHSVKAQTFQDSGGANAYVATPVSGAGGTLLPADYAAMNGAVIAFKASAANTGASTINIGQTTGTLLGTKAVVNQDGSVLQFGAIASGSYVQLRYDSSIGAGSWVLLPWASAKAASAPSFLNSKMTVLTASASATFTADSVTALTALGGTAYQIPSFSKVINLATTGAGGMDTGTAPVSGWVAIYAIYNPTTGVSALLAQNSPNVVMTPVYSGANMPAGFTASALLTVVATNGSSQFKPVAVRNRRVFIQLTQSFSSATAGTNPVSISGIVPANAIAVMNGELTVSNSTASAMSLTIVSEATGLLGQQNITAQVNGNSWTSNYGNVPLTTPQVYTTIGSSSAGVPLFVAYISGYEI
jgi:hypothetical protein